jgi:hypothetical protein
MDCSNLPVKASILFANPSALASLEIGLLTLPSLDLSTKASIALVKILISNYMRFNKSYLNYYRTAYSYLSKD